MRIRHVELVDIQLRDEEDGRWRMRVLSRIGGHGYHYFESPEFALRWLAEMIEAERLEKGHPQQE